MSKKTIGHITKSVIDLLQLKIAPNTPIILGEENIKHMKSQHPDDFKKYFSQLSNILSTPDYVIPNPKDGSLQYIKKFDDYVLTAVRVSGNNVYFSKSLYTMGTEKIERFNKNGLFNKYKL